MLSLCREISSPYRQLSITFESQSFPVTGSTKALLVSVSLKNVAIFFPPYYTLFQLQAGFSVIVSPHVQDHASSEGDIDARRQYFLDRVVIHNSSTAYFSSDSLIKMSTWGSKNITMTTEKKYFSYAQFLLNDGRPSTALCGTSLLDMRCGAVLYKIQIVNFVVWDNIAVDDTLALTISLSFTFGVRTGHNGSRMEVFAYALVPGLLGGSYQRRLFREGKWS